ncbi:MAG: bifunctional precorrin-2 dehydrogenase/sirohydrochlorin ferrochelatase [Candidatus Bathyarchaeota archaeon]|nr:bifunctional precorrin-2 dehydrogenase/sirohydrochlorin ferrochelatase [Candidatus Bathyarchaeota archaeon]
MLIDLRIEGKKVLVIGGGVLGERKITSLLEHSPDVTLISKTFTSTLQTLGKEGKITLIEGDVETKPSLLTSNIPKADLVFAATNDSSLNETVSKISRDYNVLVCAVDMPSICDFYSPATFRKGSIRVGVCTDGKSPLMSRVLRQRLENAVTEMDVLMVELQSHTRTIVKDHISDGSQRRETLYKIYNDPVIRQLLSDGNLEEGKVNAVKLIEEIYTKKDHSNQKT